MPLKLALLFSPHLSARLFLLIVVLIGARPTIVFAAAGGDFVVNFDSDGDGSGDDEDDEDEKEDDDSHDENEHYSV